MFEPRQENGPPKLANARVRGRAHWYIWQSPVKPIDAPSVFATAMNQGWDALANGWRMAMLRGLESGIFSEGMRLP
jgi:hypothetical protein